MNGFSYHEGESADPRMSAAAKRRGVVLTSRSRPLRPDDFTRFEYVVGMEEKNRRAMLEALEHWERTGRNAKCNVDLEDAVSRIRLMPEFYKDEKYSTLERVPDPVSRAGPLACRAETDARFCVVTSTTGDPTASSSPRPIWPSAARATSCMAAARWT